MNRFLCLIALAAIYAPVLGDFHNRKIFVSQFGDKVPKSLPHLQHVRTQLREQTIHNLYLLPQTVKTELIRLADTAMKGAYPVKTAIDYIEYFRNGNRMHYQDKLYAHRSRIGQLVVGNLLDREHNKTTLKYVDEIVDGLWMILQESTWSFPAHLYLQGTGDHLPVPNHLAVDLNAGEVAKMLGWVKLLLGEKLDKISTVVNKRIDHELRNRIFDAYLKTNFGWEGFGAGHSVNNWNIWVNGNILKSALFTLDDLELFDKVLNKTLHSADYFLDGYGEDGGCNEGPSYWRQAGGRLIEFLETLEQIYGTTARDYFASSNLIKLIGEYSYKMHITANWYVNFADAIPVINHPPALLAKYGALFNDENMKQFSAYMLQFVTPKNHSYYADILLNTNFVQDLNEFANFVNLHKDIESYKAIAPAQELVWMPDVQVMNVRSKKEATGSGRLFLAAKAGHNHESHNHNDVGNFVLYQDDNPVVIDIGVGTYTAQTFGSHRYELFYMQSQYHNCPTINGIDQQAGQKFTSRNTSFNQEAIHFQSDISTAYPATSGTKNWTRSFHFDRTKNVIQIDDQFELEKFIAPQQLHFIVHAGIEVTKDSTGVHLQQTNKVNVKMDFDWTIFDMKVEVMSLGGDQHLTQVWGESVIRITLTTNERYKELSGRFTVQFSAGK